jgi:hypothetical protein
MAVQGWQKLLAGYPWFEGDGNYPITAYSEFMPPPRLGQKAYGSIDHGLFPTDDPFGWNVTEYEKSLEIQPGLAMIAKELGHVFHQLGACHTARGVAQKKLDGNPYWPADVQASGAPPHERYVMLLSLALSKTQDDKGRVRWTLFGGSEQGPAQAFWKSFYSSPRREIARESSEGFVRQLLAAAYGEKQDALADLRKAGFRIYTNPRAALLPSWAEEPLPEWTGPYRWEKGPLRGVRYLLTFCPWKFLPAAVRKAYLAGELHLLPFPGSLVFFGSQPHLRLQRQLPLATQIPLLQSLCRHEAINSIRIPQSGWLHERRPGQDHQPQNYGPVRDTFRRSHRWQRIQRHEDELAVAGTEDKLTHVLLSTAPDDISLYNKPMARNAQIWNHDYQLLLDGPRATPNDLKRVAKQLEAGGLFGYRMLYPAMRVAKHEVYWQRPLVAYRSQETGEAVVLPAPLNGYFTAYSADKPRLDRAVELWPRLLNRPLHTAAVRLFSHSHENQVRQTLFNIRKLLDTRDLLGRPLTPSLARQLLTLPKHETLEDWFQSLPGRAANHFDAAALVEQLRGCIESPVEPPGRTKGRGKRPAASSLPSLTYARTSQRAYEKAYWDTISALSTGRFKNKDNADCVLDPQTRKRLKHHHRDLEALGDHLLDHYAKVATAAGMSGEVLVGELPFQWHTDFQFSWSGGWSLNQDGETYERDLVIVIPGKNRKRAVIMADHYDTAYMEDVYGYFDKGGGPRIAAAGADDNHSATAAMMLAAPIFLDLAKQGKLETDIWLVHLTGEEFPSDCMGARALCQKVVEGSLKIRLANGRWRSLAKTRVEGVYVMDMIAHNNDREKDVFQIAPGCGLDSMRLAEEAHAATEIWNASTAAWNRRAPRRDCTRGKRTTDGVTIPDVALHLPLSGEVRPPYYRRSALYNTDGQIFSDAGVPVVLFMENYDINRQGYHDTHDTLENIDLDYGAALSAIAIESVARAAGRTAIDLPS